MSYGRIGYGEGGGNLPKLGKILDEFAGKIGLLEAAAVQAALDAVNAATAFVSDDNHPMRDVIEANATVLGLATGEGTTYYGLVDGRKRAVNIDLYDNKSADGYDLETLQITFNEIVATRLVFEQSVALFAGASAEQPLENLDYITMLITNLEGVQKQTKHSGRGIKEDILPELNGLVEDFGNLTTEQKTAVLKTIDYSKNTSSTATRNALRAAIDKVVADEEAADDDISFDVTPATVTADIADQNEEGYTRDVVIKLVNTAGDTLAYNGEVAVVVAADTAGDGDASLVGDNPIMVNGVATATVALTGTYAAADTNTLTVSQKTILGVTVSAATSVETSEDASAE